MAAKRENVIKAFNGRLLFTVSLLMLSQMNFGADVATFSATQAMDAFVQRFGEYNPTTRKYALNPVYLSLLNSLTYIGQVAGVIFGGWIARKRGRKWSFYTMCFWALLSAILLVTAKSQAQMLVGRIINYIYIGQELATVPVMQSEIVPAHVRGMVVTTYQLGTMVRTRTLWASFAVACTNLTLLARSILQCIDLLRMQYTRRRKELSNPSWAILYCADTSAMRYPFLS